MNKSQSLTKKQFDILAMLIDIGGAIPQREIAAKACCSLGTVNKTLRELSQLGFISGTSVTEKGLEALEPYRAKRAVFLAAGIGSRLIPVSLNTPKPLVHVKGTPMIEGLIDACLKAGIEEIVVVRGYFSEQFDQLLYKYPTIRFIENPLYNESNDISSAYYARRLLENAYVFESDLILHNPRLIRKYHYTSDFLGIPKERSDDWCFDVRDGVIVREKFGGYNCFQMVGISYWNKADGKKLCDHIAQAYDMPGGKERYWEEVPLTVFRESYQVRIIPCSEEDVIEIDTLNELKAADPAYAMF